ncbi:MAG: alpha/beta hydrolase [Pseudomonadota bacterium]
MTDTFTQGLSTQGLSAYTHARTDGARDYKGGAAPLALTFHGTGGDERQFHTLAGELLPGAHVISPLGDVREGPHARFFRRTGEGVYDMADLARATGKMAGFIEAARAETGASLTVALGYSNGANIIASVAFQRPDLFDDLVLMHPLIPFAPAPQPGLAGKRVLITAGRRDPIGPAIQTEALQLWFEKQDANVTVAWHEGGHDLRQTEIEAVQAFLSR